MNHDTTANSPKESGTNATETSVGSKLVLHYQIIFRFLLMKADLVTILYDHIVAEISLEQ